MRINLKYTLINKRYVENYYYFSYKGYSYSLINDFIKRYNNNIIPITNLMGFIYSNNIHDMWLFNSSSFTKIYFRCG